MADKGFSLINLDGISDVAIKFLDMIEDAVGWMATPRGSKKDFNDAVGLYKNSIEEDSKYEGISRYAKLSTARKELKQYINKGKIITYAIPSLKKEAIMDIDYDWLAYFFSYAENVSDDSVQKIWARILAEKCNGDTSIKRTLIHILSLLDAKTASSFGKLCRITLKYPQMAIYEEFGTKFISEYIPLVINPKLSGLHLALPKEHEKHKFALEYRDCIPNPSDIAILQEIGLIELPERTDNDFEYPYKLGLIKHDFSGKGNKYQSSKIDDYIVDYNDIKYKISAKTVEGLSDLSEIQEKLPETIKFGLVKFTTVGESLYKMLKLEEILGFDSIFRLYMEAQKFNVEEIS